MDERKMDEKKKKKKKKKKMSGGVKGETESNDTRSPPAAVKERDNS